MIPELATGRLVLRGMERADFPAFAAIWQEPEVMHYLGRAPRPVSESWAVFLRIAGNWAIEGFGQWGVFRRADGAFLGQTGFFTAMRGLGPDFDDAPEAGWVLTAAAHGQGYGAEAAGAAHAWFDAQPFGGKSRAMIEIGHRASFRVAEQLGYRFLREAEDMGDRVMLLTRDRPREVFGGGPDRR